MLKNNDNGVFDFGKSDIFEDRNYFQNGTLIRQLNNSDCGAPAAESYLKVEEKRLLMEFNQLLDELQE